MEEISNGEDDLPNYLKVLLIFLVIWQFAFNVSNNAISYLLRFLNFFVLSNAFQNEMIKRSSNSVPLSLKALHKSLQITENDFVKYIVCPKCDSIYEYNYCVITRASGNNESKTCYHVSHPILT